jgi:hypothetical protein
VHTYVAPPVIGSVHPSFGELALLYGECCRVFGRGRYVGIAMERGEGEEGEQTDWGELVHTYVAPPRFWQRSPKLWRAGTAIR